MLSIGTPVMLITNTPPILPVDTPVLWPWKIMMEKTELICSFKGYWAMGEMYLFMFYPNHIRVGEIDLCMN